MKLFFALTFDSLTKQNLLTYQNRLREHAITGCYLAPRNFHMTLAFIGESTEPQKDTLRTILQQLKSACPSLVIDHFGSFYQHGEPLIWLGINPSHSLMTLHAELNKKLKVQGFRTEHQYIPHITLIRHADGDLTPAAIPINPLSVRVASVALMESQCVDHDRVYHVVDEWKY